MSDKNLARRVEVECEFNGVNITKSIIPYLKDITYTDSEEDNADDLQITLQDREEVWANQWISDMINSSVNNTFSLKAVILRKNWNGDGKDDLLDCGTFELDDVDYSGPPDEMRIKATSLPYSKPIRDTKRSRAWEAYNLSGIAREIADSAGMSLLYSSAKNPLYDRREQYRESDFAFLSRLCHDAGISLKVTNKIVVLFDQAEFEKRDTITKIKKGDGSYTDFSANLGKAKKEYTSCRISCVNADGQLIEGIAYNTETEETESNMQRLDIKANVKSIGEAQNLAQKMLRLNNKYGCTISFLMPGNTALLAGETVEVEKFGYWDGKYIISEAVHSVNESYTTRLNLRKVVQNTKI